MKKTLALALFLALAFFLQACDGGESAKSDVATSATPSNSLVLNGSTTVLPLAQKAVDSFKKTHPNVNISLTGGGSGIGMNALIDGISDIALSSRNLKPEEKEKLGKKRMEVKEHVVAWDGIVPVVHPSNPVKNLSIEQLKGIFSGKITDWKEVGGKPGPIEIISRDQSSGTFEAWSELVMGDVPVATGAQSKSSSEMVFEAVAVKPNAIGYEGMGIAEGNPKIKPVSVEGQLASPANVLDKTYKIARPLYVFTRANTNPTVTEFVDFMLSAEGQGFVKEAKFVAIK